MAMAGVRMPLESYPAAGAGLRAGQADHALRRHVEHHPRLHVAIRQGRTGDRRRHRRLHLLFADRRPAHRRRTRSTRSAELFPVTRRLKMLRNWGGIVDVTPDRSPIIGKTPVPGLFVNCGWGTGGFKATPGSGHVFAAHCRARRAAPDRRPVLARALHHRPPDRRSGRRRACARYEMRLTQLSTRRAGHSLMLLIRCPSSARRTVRRSSSAMAARRTSRVPPIRRARRTRSGRSSFTSAHNPKGLHAERWRHIHGCGRYFNAVRHTVTDRILDDVQGRRAATRSRSRHGAERMTDALPHPLRRPHRPPPPRRLHFRRPALSRLRRRHAGLGAARQRRPSRRPLVQVSPPARHSLGRLRRTECAGRPSTRSAARSTPNLRATQVELYDGLIADSQNRWPSLAFDVGAVNDRFGTLFPAGFYYKTFMGPGFLGSNKAWTRLYEPFIRRAAGLGARPAVARSRPLRQPLRALRRARRRRRPGWPCSGAGSGAMPAPASSSATSRPSSADRCSAKPSPASMACRRCTGSPRQ